MPIPRKPGRRRKDKSSLTIGERMLDRVDAAVSEQRRRISAQDRLWLVKYRETDFLDAEKAAKEAGFVTPNMGEKLALRLANLVEAEKMRATLDSQMEVDEALRLLAGLARSSTDAKVQHAALRTVLQVHGVLGDKRVEAEDRKRLAAEVGEMVREIKSGGSGAVLRIREMELSAKREITAAAQTVEAEAEAAAD